MLAAAGRSAGVAVRLGSGGVEADGSRTKIGVADVVLRGDAASWKRSRSEGQESVSCRVEKSCEGSEARGEAHLGTC